MTVTCQPATVDGPAAAADPAVRQMIAESVTLSRQNIDVTLAFSNYTFTGGVFAANVTVQNLLNQTLGDTITGNASLYGTRVFFVSNPPVAVTSGSGTATIQAPDTGTFTASFQPYFDYSTPIAPGATSAAQNWKFKLATGVKGFTFSVEISTILPAEKSVRRWVTLSEEFTADSLTGVWRHTGSDIDAVGVGGTVLQYTASRGPRSVGFRRRIIARYRACPARPSHRCGPSVTAAPRCTTLPVPGLPSRWARPTRCMECGSLAPARLRGGRQWHGPGPERDHLEQDVRARRHGDAERGVGQRRDAYLGGGK